MTMLDITDIDDREVQKDAKRPPVRRRNHYSEAFRRGVATLVVDQDRSVVEVSKQLNINPQTLYNWVQKERIMAKHRASKAEAKRAFSSERPPVAHAEIELAQWRAEVARLRAEKAELKNATVLLFKEFS